MKNLLKVALLGITISANAQISTGTGGASNVLANSPTTNTNVGIGTTTPKGRFEIVALANGQTFTDYGDAYQKSLLLNIGAPRDATYRLLTFSDLPTSNVTAKSETAFNIEDRNDSNRFRHVAQAGGTSGFYLSDKVQASALTFDEDGTNVFLVLPKPESYLSVGGPCVWPVAHKFWVKTGTSKFEDNVFMNSNLCIGSTNFADGATTYKLSVKGKIRAEEIKVYTTWADYVFNADYKLPTLKEVESFINKNGHLQNVPSAKEVAENGVQLGEMSKIQQEKIEELTLYLIKQNKEIEELKAQVKILMNKK